jgi:hypothetical protein
MVIGEDEQWHQKRTEQEKHVTASIAKLLTL